MLNVRHLLSLLFLKMTVFEHLQDKDVFQKFYIKALARRLIHSASISDDAEEELISRMKLACGSEYTASMQRMVQDITLSKDLNASFQEYRARLGQVQKTSMWLSDYIRFISRNLDADVNYQSTSMLWS